MGPLFTSNKVKLDNNQQIQAGIYTNQRTILLVEITILQATESLLHNQLKPEQNLLNQLQYLNQLSGSKPPCKIDTGIASLPHNITRVKILDISTNSLFYTKYPPLLIEIYLPLSRVFRCENNPINHTCM